MIESFEPFWLIWATLGLHVGSVSGYVVAGFAASVDKGSDAGTSYYVFVNRKLNNCLLTVQLLLIDFIYT